MNMLFAGMGILLVVAVVALLFYGFILHQSVWFITGSRPSIGRCIGAMILCVIFTLLIMRVGLPPLMAHAPEVVRLFLPPAVWLVSFVIQAWIIAHIVLDEAGQYIRFWQALVAQIFVLVAAVLVTINLALWIIAAGQTLLLSHVLPGGP